MAEREHAWGGWGAVVVGLRVDAAKERGVVVTLKLHDGSTVDLPAADFITDAVRLGSKVRLALMLPRAPGSEAKGEGGES